MAPNEAKIKEFRGWLLNRGRSLATAALYAVNVRSCFDDRRGVTARLVRDGLAPKTKRANLASLRAWARWTGDLALTEQLSDLKLPPPERVTEKLPLSLKQWQDLIDAIPHLGMSDAEENAVEMICIRGFRVGDVCRLDRRAVRDGLRTGLLNYRGKSGRQIEWTVKPFESQLRWFADQTGWEVVADLVAPGTADRFHTARQRLYRLFRKLAALIDIDASELSPHRLRRTYAVHFLDSVNGDLEKLRQHMGWASIATAAQYVDHSRREELDKIAEDMAKRRER